MQRITELKTLTALHDSISAWAGLGSALATLFNQVSIPASVLGTLSVVGYLGCISTLHISIPAILSVEAFNATVEVTIPASTSGMPEYANSSVINSTHDYMITFPVNFLEWKGILDVSQMVGLSNGSLYEVLDATTPGNGKARVSAYGFNITCGHLSSKIKDVVDIHTDTNIDTHIDILIEGVLGSMFLEPQDLAPNTLSLYSSNPGDATTLANLNDSFYIYTTATILDSEGHQGSPLIFEQQSLSVIQKLTDWHVYSSQLQILRCSKTLVAQIGVISTHSNTIVNGTLYPDIHKNQSTWLSGLELEFSSPDSSLLGDDLFSAIFFDPFDLDPTADKCENGSRYLMSYLGLNPYANTSGAVLQLHNVENALSNLAAMLFWTVAGIPPKLSSGNATITQQETSQVRLNASLGLITSVIQMSLCTTFLRTSTKSKGNKFHGVGLLAYIWWWRNQRKSSTPIRNVQKPIEANLRTAGLVPLQHTNEKNTASKENEWTSVGSPSMVCMLLHVVLVISHVAALVLAIQRKEHSVTFSPDNQQTVSLICKIATTAFGTIYYATLVYLTQRVATIHTIQKYSLLTATHDKRLAWTGIGSAFSTLWEQRKSPRPCVEIFVICVYLATISGLHVTTSALVSVESCNLFISSKVQTQSVPEWSDTAQNSTLKYIASNGPFLQWISGLDDSKKLGLSNGSLYDVLEQAYPGGGLTEVSAVGFNITCGYIPDIAVKRISDKEAKDMGGCQGCYTMSVVNGTWQNTEGPLANFIFILISNPLDTDSIILMTQNAVHDSNDALGSPVTFPHSNTTFQFLQCSNTPVPQIGLVNASSRLLDPSSLHPTIYKHTSAWRAHQNVSRAPNQTSMLEGTYILSSMPASVLYLSNAGLNWGSRNLMQQLGLNPGGAVQEIYLHDIENALSNLVASIFWIDYLKGGNVHRSPVALQSLEADLHSGPIDPPKLSTGNATVQQVVSAARLDVSISLAGSVFLLILVCWMSIGTNGSNQYLTTLGFLQIIWVFEHHPELHGILEQVDIPTGDNLRAAGLVNHHVDRVSKLATRTWEQWGYHNA
ncbi:hypothetical protein GGX14DRAFT_394336 [Mycena pura]|uniref:Uncharacterized protein n=1 Tax=Mycena pura TaxID=153505 RepID=A0AAD6VI70_9AGAR|nr:hypothetical protein GGX14DRAFT_394336 [Mycena pura]